LHRQGGTIVLVTHDPQIAARAQRQIHIVDGRIVELKKSVGSLLTQSMSPWAPTMPDSQ
jgi:putative ABC transport system ATP-binding protein